MKNVADQEVILTRRELHWAIISWLRKSRPGLPNINSALYVDTDLYTDRVVVRWTEAEEDTLDEVVGVTK